MLRRIKPIYTLYNVFRKQALKHNVQLYKKYGLNKRYYSPINSRDFDSLPDTRNWLDEGDSASLFPENSRFQNLATSHKEAILNWSSDGFAILPEFLSGDEVDRVNAEVDGLIESGQANWKFGKKIMFAFQTSEVIRSIGTDQRLIELFELIQGRSVELFQSINFLEPSEQPAHSDALHMTTYPVGNVIAVWFALEDVTENNGPLFYYPGSHKLPYLRNRDFGNEGNWFMTGGRPYAEYGSKVQEVVRTHGLEKKSFHAKRGDALIWHANLLHGGEKARSANQSRKSMVFHYYSQDVICYHEVSQRPTLKS